MGQKNTRIDDSNLESFSTEQNRAVCKYKIVEKEPHLNHNASTPNFIFSKAQVDKFKNLYNLNKDLLFDKTEVINNTNSKTRTNSRSSSTPRPVVQTELSQNTMPTKSALRSSTRRNFVNNFYVFLNKENASTNEPAIKSVSYYLPGEKFYINQATHGQISATSPGKRSKSVSHLFEKENLISIIKLNEIKFVEEFDEFELKTIEMTYKYIKDDLNNVGVIAFMKSFETLPDMIDKFETFKYLPIDELSKSHALRTHSKKVMNIIDQFVIALQDKNLDKMKEKLFALGERHHIYRAKKEYFLIIECQFINAIKPIITKNLQIIQKSQLIEVSEHFSTVFDDEFHRSIEDDFYIDSYLNNEEICKTFDLIKLVWHKVFGVIRCHMDRGMDSFENKIKGLSKN